MSRTDLQESLFVTNEYGITHQNPSATLTKEQVDFAGKEWGINTDLHRTCINCQIRQMLKYENHLDKNTGDHTKKFMVPCKGIAKNLPAGSQEVVRKMVEEEGMDRARAQLILQSTIDPVAWAELMFGFNDNNPTWYIRPYQKEQLRCSSQRIVIREGRRSGKTFLVALKLLYFVFNRLVKTVIDEKGTMGTTGPTILIVTPYQSQLLTVFDEMEKILKKNKGLCAEVSSASGDSLYVRTPFFHMDFRNGAEIKGFVSGVGIKADGSGGGTMRGISAQVIYLDEMDMIPEETIDKVIMPILLSDLAGDTCFIATSTPIGKRARFYKLCFTPETLVETTYGYRPIGSLSIKNNGILNGDGKESEFSEVIENEVDESLIEIQPFCRPKVLATAEHPVMTMRGWVQAKDLQITDYLFVPVPQITIDQPALQVEKLKLLMMNVAKTALASKLFGKKGTTVLSEELGIPRRTLQSYKAEMLKYGFIADERRHKSFQTIQNFFAKWTSEFDDLDARVLGLYLAEGCVIRDLKRDYRMGLQWTFHMKEQEYVQAVVDWASKHGLKSRVVLLPEVHTTCVVINCSWLAYLFEVEIGISHNKQIPRWLPLQFVQPMFKGLLEGDGYEVAERYVDWTITLTARDILTRMDQLLRYQGELPSLTFDQRPDKKATAILHSQKGRYAEKAGENGWWVKVQSLDTVPYKGLVYNLEVPDTNTYSVGFTVHNCLEDPTFKEDYLPSSVLPQWNINKALIIGDSTPESIQTEFMAAFIDGNFGVFKPSYVYRARTDYSYEDCNDQRWWKKTWAVTDNSMIIRCIGIDWNKNAGTEFVVITYVPHANKYILSEAVNIPAGEFSALSWREELIRLNYKWKPDYIYADEGYGHTIIEDLKLIAFHLTSKPNKNLQDVETTKLTERLKSFNFSSKVSLRNPLDGTIMEKGGKDFLVETARRIFEDPAAIIRFPEAEEQLKNELLHYTTLRRSPTTNKAVYGTDSERIGDHRLDAMMLGLAGIQIEAGLYSDSAMPVSNPTFLSKERLDKRAEVTPDTPGSAFIKFMEKQSVVTPIGVNVTQIVREGETPEQAASRGNRGARIERRPGHEEPNTVHEHFKKLQSTAGYDTDRESPQSTPKVINGRRHNPDRTIRRRG